MLDMYHVFQGASAEAVKRVKPDIITEDTLKDVSESVVAWITIDDTKLDYPIVQAEDNTYFVNRDIHGEYSLSGSIFLDFRNSPDFTDSYSLVYGHHMANDLMFGILDRFKDEDFFYAHRTGTLYVGNIEYRFKVIGFMVTTTAEDEVFNTERSETRMSFFRNNLMYFQPQDIGKHIIALTTCKDPGTTDRTVLVISY